MATALFTGCVRETGSQTAKEVQVHPYFDLSMASLSDLTDGLPENIRNKILERPEYFLDLMSRILTLPDITLALVDKNHGLPPDYAPLDLVSLDKYNILVNRKDLLIRKYIAPDLLAMNEAAVQQGLFLLCSSTYRSYDYQKQLYERNVNELGQVEADRVSAKPGTSQHQLGTVIDFGSITEAFAETPEGAWLKEHAWEYGFSLSYPEGFEPLTGYKYECWHYRYVTRTAAEMIKYFFEGIQQYFLVYFNDHRSIFISHRIQQQN